MTTETLTVVYCTDQTYPFAQTVDGIVGVTVRDSGENYYRYFPSIDRKQPLSGTPSEYAWDVVNQVDYIENTAKARILTGYTGTPFDDIIEVKYQATDATHAGMVLGNDIAGGIDYEWWYNYASNDRFIISISNSRSTMVLQYEPLDENIHTLIRDGIYTYCDNVLTGTLNNEVFPSTFSNQYALFCRYITGGSYYFFGKIYYAKFSHNGSLVRDFIPIQISNGEYCLYEKCLTGNVIYHNDGPGTFTGGGTPVPLTYTHTISPTVSLWNGTRYTDGTVKVWNGSQYVDADAIWVWNGSQYVEKAG